MCLTGTTSGPPNGGAFRFAAQQPFGFYAPNQPLGFDYQPQFDPVPFLQQVEQLRLQQQQQQQQQQAPLEGAEFNLQPGFFKPADLPYCYNEQQPQQFQQVDQSFAEPSFFVEHDQSAAYFANGSFQKQGASSFDQLSGDEKQQPQQHEWASFASAPETLVSSATAVPAPAVPALLTNKRKRSDSEAELHQLGFFDDLATLLQPDDPLFLSLPSDCSPPPSQKQKTCDSPSSFPVSPSSDSSHSDYSNTDFGFISFSPLPDQQQQQRQWSQDLPQPQPQLQLQLQAQPETHSQECTEDGAAQAEHTEEEEHDEDDGTSPISGSSSSDSPIQQRSAPLTSSSGPSSTKVCIPLSALRGRASASKLSLPCQPAPAAPQANVYHPSAGPFMGSFAHGFGFSHPNVPVFGVGAPTPMPSTLVKTEFTLEVDEDATLEDIKLKIAEIEGLSLEQQRGVHNGRRLDDSTVLASCKTSKANPLRIVLRY